MDITAIIGAIAAGLGVIGTISAFIRKHYKRAAQVREDEARRKKLIDKLPSTLDRIEEKINTTCQTVEDLESKFDLMDTQFLKYRITDAFYGYGGLANIPYEVLVGASQCGELYMRKGLNHEIGSQVKLINEELENRQRQKANSDKEAVKSNE